MKRWLISALLVLTACSQAEKNETQCLRLNVSEDPQSLDPRMVRSSRDLSLCMQLFEGLTRLDAKGKPQLGMAKSVDISPDGLEYTFHLRECQWSNGQCVTAFDFEKSWKQVLSPDFPTDYAHMLFAISNAKDAKTGKKMPSEIGVRALNEKTLFVQLELPTPYFLELTAFPTLFPFKEENVSNGPFVLTEWKRDEKIAMKKNAAYWDKENVHFEELNFSIIPDTMTESYLYEKGDLDWLGQPLSQNIVSDLLLKLREKNALSSYSVAGTYWLKFNTQKPPFNDATLRKALSYVLNRKEIIEHILHGNQKVATALLPPSMALSEQPLFQDHDTVSAQLLLQNYLKEHPAPEIKLSFIAHERNSKIMQYVADTWRKKLGLHVTLEGMERKVYQQLVKSGEFQVGSGDWIADFNDPISFLELFQSYDATTSSLIAAARQENDSVKRSQLLSAAEKLLIDEMVVAPLYFYSWDYVKNPSIKDVVLSPLGPVDFKWARKE